MLRAATKTALFRFMANHTCNIKAATSDMHTQQSRDCQSNRKSYITHHFSDIRYDASAIIYGKWHMLHQLFLMHYPLWHIPYPKSQKDP